MGRAKSTPANPTECEFLKYETAIWWATRPKTKHSELLKHAPFGPRDDNLMQEPDIRGIMAAARQTPEFQEEMNRLKACKAAAQNGHARRHQMLAADGTPMMNKLL